MKKLVIIGYFFMFTIMTFSEVISGKTIKVADGDTITILLQNKKKERIRFYGIDAPESTQEYGIKSLDVLKNLIENKDVKVEIKERDMYGRIVGIVYYQNKNINLHMIETGNAWYYRQYAKGNTEFEKAEKAARDSQIGLWKNKNPQAPWDYRKNKKTDSKNEKDTEVEKDDELQNIIKLIEQIFTVILKLIKNMK